MPSGRFVTGLSIRPTIESRVRVNDARLSALRPGRKTRGPVICHNAEINDGNTCSRAYMPSSTTLSIAATGSSVPPFAPIPDPIRCGSGHVLAEECQHERTRPCRAGSHQGDCVVTLKIIDRKPFHRARFGIGRAVPARHAIRLKSFRSEAARRSYRRVRSPFPLACRHPHRLQAPRYSLRSPGHDQRSSYSLGCRQRGRSGVRGS